LAISVGGHEGEHQVGLFRRRFEAAGLSPWRATTLFTTCRMARARGPSTGSSQRPPSSWQAGACGRTWWTRARSAPGGWTTLRGVRALTRLQRVDSSRPRTRRTWWDSCFPGRGRGWMARFLIATGALRSAGHW